MYLNDDDEGEYGFGYGDEGGFGYGDEGGFGYEGFDEEDEGGFDEEVKLVQTYDEKLQSVERDDCGIIGRESLKLLYKSSDTPQVFKIKVGMISIDIDKKNISKINPNTRNRLCRIANNIPRVQKLNPTAFILGFLVTDNQGKIIPGELKKIFSKLHKLDDNSVKEPDIIRYARYFEIRQLKQITI